MSSPNCIANHLIIVQTFHTKPQILDLSVAAEKNISGSSETLGYIAHQPQMSLQDP